MSLENENISAKELFEKQAKQKRALYIWCGVSFSFLGLAVIGGGLCLSWGAQIAELWPFMLLMLYVIPLMYFTWRSYKKYRAIQTQVGDLQKKDTVEGDYAKKRDLMKKYDQAKWTVLLGPVLVLYFLLLRPFPGVMNWVMVALAAFGVVRMFFEKKKYKQQLDEMAVSAEEERAFKAENNKTRKTAITIIVVIALAVFFIVTIVTSGGSSNSSSSSKSSQKCYVCGKSGSIRYGSHYYCGTHYAMVKTVVDAN